MLILFLQNDKKIIRKAFNLAVEAHKDMRRKSGEPYIYHPIAVAHIAAKERAHVVTSKAALATMIVGLVAVAAGAGGHAGTLSPFALIQEIREWFDGPLLLSGAIANLSLIHI